MFFKKTDKKEENNFIVKVCALLIHAAKIDENYTDIEAVSYTHLRAHET